jgi:hypothetical protein
MFLWLVTDNAWFQSWYLVMPWVLFVLGASVLEESGAKIAAALKGDQLPRGSGTGVSVRMRRAPRPAPLRLSTPRLCAAA